MKTGTKYALGALATLLVLAAAWYLSAPYLTLWRLERAVENEDEEAIRELVDFPRVRENLTADLQGAAGSEIQERVGDGPFAALGQMLGDAAIEEIVDAYVSPDGVIQLAHGQDPTGSGAPEEEPPEFTITRRSVDVFVVTPETALDESPRFVFSRQGLVWRLVRIETALSSE